MSNFWHFYIIGIVVVNLVFLLWLLFWTPKQGPDVPNDQPVGHEFDGIEELNQPLPRWWLGLFVISMIFSFAYLALYPGMGNFKGVFGWTSASQWEAEVETADKYFSPVFEAYAAKSIEELAVDGEALKVGQRLFANNCALCHGANAKGGVGFPNLTDNDWLYGGSPEQIKTTLVQGRRGAMPAFAHFNDEQMEQLIAYTLSLSGRRVDRVAAAAGESQFKAICAACHGSEGTGNYAIGAPNLTDQTWLYGSSESAVREALMNGRNGVMPAFKETLSEEKIHVLSAYVYSLSLEEKAQ